jgi:hypothetical protein
MDTGAHIIHETNETGETSRNRWKQMKQWVLTLLIYHMHARAISFDIIT